MTRSTLPSASPRARLGLLVGLEARERLHDDREPGIPLGEGVEVLLHEQGRRHEHGDLLAVLHALNAARTAISVLP
jgi:hypothetical protein